MMKSMVVLTAMAVSIGGSAIAEAPTIASEPLAKTHKQYTLKQYKTYAKKVYKRKTISRKAKAKMRDMILHLEPQKHVKIARKIRANLIRERKAAQCSNSNPTACAYDAAARYGVSAQWLIACANSEGGLGLLDYRKMNTGGSGAGGNWQFMYGTFASAIRRMGVSPKPWLNSKWQAMAAAFKFSQGESGEWTGAGC